MSIGLDLNVFQYQNFLWPSTFWFSHWAYSCRTISSCLASLCAIGGASNKDINDGKCSEHCILVSECNTEIDPNQSSVTEFFLLKPEGWEIILPNLLSFRTLSLKFFIKYLCSSCSWSEYWCASLCSCKRCPLHTRTQCVHPLSLSLYCVNISFTALSLIPSPNKFPPLL